MEEIRPADIERRSMEIIGAEMGPHSYTKEQLPVVKRCIHTSADFDYGKNLFFTPGAVAAGLEAIRGGCTIVTDTNMALSGVNKRILEGRFGGRGICFMADSSVAEEARDRGLTRAAVSMERAVALEGPVIFAIGNAPTALVKICRLMEEGRLSPALVIGAPVGFVNVEESKALLETMAGEYIVARGRKGGSGIAAAVCNAMLYMAAGDRRD